MGWKLHPVPYIYYKRNFCRRLRFLIFKSRQNCVGGLTFKMENCLDIPPSPSFCLKWRLRRDRDLFSFFFSHRFPQNLLLEKLKVGDKKRANHLSLLEKRETGWGKEDEIVEGSRGKGVDVPSGGNEIADALSSLPRSGSLLGVLCTYARTRALMGGN